MHRRKKDAVAMLNAHYRTCPQLSQMVARASLFPGVMTLLREQMSGTTHGFCHPPQCEGHCTHIDTHTPNSLFFYYIEFFLTDSLQKLVPFGIIFSGTLCCVVHFIALIVFINRC